MKMDEWCEARGKGPRVMGTFAFCTLASSQGSLA